MACATTAQFNLPQTMTSPSVSPTPSLTPPLPRMRSPMAAGRACTLREVLSEVFLETPPSSAATSALFIGWGLLVGYDLFLNGDNASDPFDMECNNVTLADVWCPEGSLSDPIPFHRSQGELDTEGDGTRSPTNFATAFVDLDWIYGRDEDSATALRTSESGYLNLTAAELPHLLPDGTWLVSGTQMRKLRA